jgi:hypothetical protein
MTNLDTQYRAAQARLSAADDAVRRASRGRLSALRRLSEREQFEHVADADLTLEDRALLRRLICQTALERDPLSASKRDPFDRRARAVALAPSELVGVAETARARLV